MRAEEFLVEDVPSWQWAAACGRDAEGFLDATVREKKRVCRRCPVREDCLTYAVEQGETWGVWGGRDFGRHAGRSR